MDTYCNIHPINTVNQFCIDCDLAACDRCLLRKHRHHNLVDLAEQAPTSRKELESILEEINVVITLVDDQIADRENTLSSHLTIFTTPNNKSIK